VYRREGKCGDTLWRMGWGDEDRERVYETGQKEYSWKGEQLIVAQVKEGE
jgi:hypothetical protein